MPRTSWPTNRDYWKEPPDESSGNPENECMDFCRECTAGDEAEGVRWLVNNAPIDMPFHVVWNAVHDLGEDHPPYDDLKYACRQCGKLLTSEDD